MVDEYICSDELCGYVISFSDINMVVRGNCDNDGDMTITIFIKNRETPIVLNTDFNEVERFIDNWRVFLDIEIEND